MSDPFLSKLAKALPDSPKHHHRLTVPVEWKVSKYMNNLRGSDYTKPIAYKVTKLKCESCPAIEELKI